jgi:protein TonB
MYYAPPVDRRSRYVGLAVVGALHVALIWAAATMVRSNGSALIPEVLTTEIIQEVPPPPEEPPPPPPEIEIDLAPMPDMVVLPEIVFDTPPPPTTITQVAKVETIPDTRPVVPAKGTEPVKKASVVTQPELPSRLTKPDYPRRSTQLNEEGITTMRICVNAKGRVTEASVTESSGSERLDAAAVDWVTALRGIKPKKIDGKAVDGGCMILPLEWEITEP